MYSVSLLTLFRDESGASAVEYGLIVALVAVFLVAALDGMGSSVSQTVTHAATSLKAG
ncbi:MAG: Flp family type IVb pilin [Alphaproteobacteria bacterium]